jgi:uncharacterized cofD-like protein
MNKKVVTFGGGTGLSILLRGLKHFPLDISAIVSVCDDGKSTGRLREEFKTPAVGDIRRVLISLSTTEPLFEKLFNYRFKTTSDLNGHTVGNLLLTAAKEISGSFSNGIDTIGKVLNLKGKVIPLTEQDDITLMGKMEDGTIIEGEHKITEDERKIIDVFYKEKPVVTPEAIQAIKEADLIILSMGSVFTSIIPNLICDEIRKELEKSQAKIMYVCNMMTQPGETDNLSASEHVKLLNRYLGKRSVDVIVVNNGPISDELKYKYETLEQKDPVLFDEYNLKQMGIDIIANDFVIIEDEMIRHNVIKLASNIFSYLI